MQDKILGEVSYNTGWEKSDSIVLWGRQYTIITRASAKNENDPITTAQQEFYINYERNKASFEQKIENLLANSRVDACKNLTPRFLVIRKNGKVALMLDDSLDPDDGIAVQLAPIEKVWSQNAYL